MEKQEFSTEVLQKCSTLLKKQILNTTVLLDFYKKKLAIMEQRKANLNSNSNNEEVEFVNQKIESLNYQVDSLTQRLRMFKAKTPEKLAADLLKEKNEHERELFNAKLNASALSMTEEELNNLPPQKKQKISERRENFESEIFEDALIDLNIKEEQAELPKNKEKIIKRCEELKAEEIEYYNNEIKRQQEIIDMPLEQYVEQQLAWVEQSFNRITGEVREFSLVEAMGLQHASLSIDSYDLRTNSIELRSEQVEKIAELSEEEFEAMKIALSTNKEEYKKMQIKSEKVNKIAAKIYNIIEKITKITPITTFGGLGVAITGTILGSAEAVSETAAGIMVYAGGSTAAISLGTLISTLPAGIATKLVEVLTKNANVEAKKAVENYLKGLPIKTNKQDLELGAN